MNSPITGTPQRLTSQDLIRLKEYLADTLLRAMEMEGIEAAQRPAFLQQNIGRAFNSTQLKLPEDLKKDIFKQVLNDLLGYKPSSLYWIAGRFRDHGQWSQKGFY